MVFLVDACDRSRLAESKAELDALLTDETLANCPVLVLGNKIDRPEACSEEELRGFFGLHSTTGKVLNIVMHAKYPYYLLPPCSRFCCLVTCV